MPVNFVAELQRGIQVLEIMLILDISYGDDNNEGRSARLYQIETGTLEEHITIVNKKGWNGINTS